MIGDESITTTTITQSASLRSVEAGVLKSLKTKQAELENEIAELRTKLSDSVKRNGNLEEEVATERREKEELRERAHARATGQKEEHPICEICLEEFSEVAPLIPRVLGCGHSLCEECCRKLLSANDNTVLICPFDRLPTLLPETTVGSLPKNFSVIQMIRNEAQRESEVTYDNVGILITTLAFGFAMYYFSR
ncbi:unnamed protein product [Caenorhabditis sp. 36 PRJEB53466]|nr:unnamed protein product [Caenorhabditis sp. 36 PRJEB53466]